ncbi:MAG: insulinase family protein, partial [Beijerinckiaceae bacterium]|nr:insulinase family protein [Beijerinckiaceae bacterium]
ALEVLAYLLGGGHTSLLFKTLVMDRKFAVTAGAYYQGTAVDDTRFYVYAIPAPGAALETVDGAVDEVIARVAGQGVDEADLQRAKTRLIAETIYAQDNQAALARWYGASLAAGLSLEDVSQWPERIDAVAADDVKKAALWLDKRRSVTGYLLPAEPGSGVPGAETAGAFAT